MLSRVCVLQKQYGKTKQELEELVEGFAWLLADFPMAAVAGAFKSYLRERSDIPAPADIIAIIKREEEETRMRLTPPQSVETLLRYCEKGIPLSQAQKQRLTEAGYPLD